MKYLREALCCWNYRAMSAESEDFLFTFECPSLGNILKLQFCTWLSCLCEVLHNILSILNKLCAHIFFFLTQIFRIMFQLLFWSQGGNIKLYQLCIFYILFYNNFLSCQSMRFPQMLSQNMYIQTHSYLKESNGKRDLQFSFLTI